MAAADLDNDGRLDLAVATLSGAGVFLNQGSARFAPEDTYTFTGGATSVAAADLDPDGLVDVLVTSGNFLGVLFNLGGGALFRTDLDRASERRHVGRDGRLRRRRPGRRRGRER